MSHLCGKSCNKNKCCNNNDPVAGTALFFIDAVSDVPPITSPTQTAGVDSLLRFTSQSLDITTSSGVGGGVGSTIGTVVIDIEAPSEFIGPPGPAGPQGSVGQVGNIGSPGPSGNSGQQGTVATWYSGSSTAGPVPTQFGPFGATPINGFLSTGFPIQTIFNFEVNNDSNVNILLIPKNSSGLINNLQATFQNVVGNNVMNGMNLPSRLFVGIVLFQYNSNLLAYDGPTFTGGVGGIDVPFGFSNVLYLSLDFSVNPITILPGDAIGIIVNDVSSGVIFDSTITVGRYFVQVV